MAVIVPSIGQLLWGEPLNNALLGLDAAIQGRASQADLTTLSQQVAAVQVTANNAQSTANNALTTAQNVPGTIKVSTTAPASPTAGQYWDNGTNLYRWNGTSWQPPNYVRPSISEQVSSPATYTAGAFTDFTSGQWAPITITVPTSGQVRVTIGAAVLNTNTTTSTGWVAWRASGAVTINTAYEKRGVSTVGARTYASRVFIITGLTAGTSLTITPQYNFSSVNASSSITSVTNGQLYVEPYPL